MCHSVRIVFPIVVFLSGLAGCSGDNRSDAQSKLAGKFTSAEQSSNANSQAKTRPKVVATFSVLGDMVHQVAGDKIELVTLVGPDGDPHSYRPTPKDSRSLQNADVIFENGAEFEGWLDRLYKASGSKARRVELSKGLKLIGCCESHDHQHSDADHHQHEHDPHVWHDVQNAMHMVKLIRDALVQVDPTSADVYQARAAKYHQELEALDKWVSAQVATLPEANRKLVTNHDCFGYFARRYGFKVVGNVLRSPSTETGSPSPRELEKLRQAIEKENIPAIFAENMHNDKLVQRLAEVAKVKVAQLYTDAIGKPGSDADTYVTMIRSNVTTIVTNLKP